MHVIPSARKNEVTSVLEDALKLRPQAPPIEDKANDALVPCLGDVLHVARAAISIVRDQICRRKVIEIASASPTVDQVKHILLPSAFHLPPPVRPRGRPDSMNLSVSVWYQTASIRRWGKVSESLELRRLP